MKWRALAVAVVCLSATLGACSFKHEWDVYCSFPGRCSKFDPASGTIPIAQGSVNRRIVLTGEYLADASTVVVLSSTGEDSGTASIASSEYGKVALDVSVFHGVPVGTQLTLNVAWQRPEKESLNSIPIEVTAIRVAAGADDDAGLGTPANPYGTLLHANQVAGFGDTIQLDPGQFAGIEPDGGCEPSSGLKPGVKVHGDPSGGSVVHGPGVCGFNLYEANQEVRQLTLTDFSAGVLASDMGFAGGPRPTVSNVTITACDAGVVAVPGAGLLLDSVELKANNFGLRAAGADVVMQNGSVWLSSSNGVVMTGNGGRLALTGLDAGFNASSETVDPVLGAGILLAADGGKVAIGGGAQSHENGFTGIAVTGLSNEVTLDGVSLQGGNLGLLVQDRDAGVLLSNTDIASDGDCIQVASFRFFNGGTGDGGYGGNTLACGTNINDTRSAGPAMDFERTSLFTGTVAVTPTSGTNVTASDPTLRIQLGGSTQVHFH